MRPPHLKFCSFHFPLSSFEFKAAPFMLNEMKYSRNWILRPRLSTFILTGSEPRWRLFLFVVHHYSVQTAVDYSALEEHSRSLSENDYSNERMNSTWFSLNFWYERCLFKWLKSLGEICFCWTSTEQLAGRRESCLHSFRVLKGTKESIRIQKIFSCEQFRGENDPSRWHLFLHLKNSRLFTQLNHNRNDENVNE